MRFILLLFSLFLLSNTAIAEAGYRIEIELSNFEEKEIYLAYHYAEKQYIKDTVAINANGQFVFEGQEALDAGVYLVVMPPENQHFQILVNDEEQQFSIKTNAKDPSSKIKIQGSKDNELFYGYLNFLASKRPEAEKLNKEKAGAQEEDKKAKIQAKLEALNAEVRAYQENIIKNYPNTLTAAIIKANLTLDMPEYEGDEKEVQTKRWRFMQKHYFDYIDLGDPRMLRTPFLFGRIDHFVHKLQVQHPDTIAKAIDEVLERLKPAEESFKYYLIHFLNSYAKSEIVGMDAVYVHLVDKYYATGQAPWTDDEQLKKIIDDANALKPLLIGKIAPDIRMQKKDGSKTSLHEVESPYTILYFWRYDCGHCKESTPHMKAFYEKFKDRGVKIFSVCTKFTDEVPECWEYIDENAIGDWLHTVDPYHRSKYSKIYNIKSTPQMYILDDKKEIISKRIGAEQLEEVMDKIIEMRKKEKVQE